jgi:RNA polymerase sigma-70 factor (ECF subfamily)
VTPEPSRHLRSPSFQTTRWTRVALAKADSDDGRTALAELCEAYYEPVVAYLRCDLRDADAARESSHAFFAEMLAGGTIATADRERGRFRSYLLGAVKHFVSRQRESARRLKRGGGAEIRALDDTEARAVADPQQPNPEAEFDRQWAVTVLARALEALRIECGDGSGAALFEAVKPMLTGDAVHGEQAALAASCGMNVEAFRMAAHRLKKRLRECVKTEVASTLDDPARVPEEMQALFAALGG